MKKLAKKVSLATTLFTGLVTGTFAQPQIEVLQQQVNEVHSLAKNTATVSDVFQALTRLTESIEKVNQMIESQRFKMSRARFDLLVVIRELLNVNSTLLIEKYEANILTDYAKVYRQYSRRIVELDLAIYNVREKLGLVKVVSIDGLTLSESELQAIHQRAGQTA